MPKRTNDIILSQLEYLNLVRLIEEVFRQKTKTPLKFTGARTSKIYDLLKQEIELTSGIILGSSFLCSLMSLKHNKRFQAVTFDALQKFVRSFSYSSTNQVLDGTQKVFWAVNQGLPAGAYIETVSGVFIPWTKLKKELEEKVINQYPKLIKPNCHIKLSDFYGRENWLIEIIDTEKKPVGNVWIGGNPYANWENDGLIRIGKTISDNSWVVYAVFARLPDGTYKTVRIYSEQEINMLK